jgi:FtsP/CotA-like multicopper oxidase with cupredoxin domain
MEKTIFLLLLTVFLCGSVLSFFSQPVSSQTSDHGLSQTPELLDPLTIPKWVNQLDSPPPVYVPTNVTDSFGQLIRQEYTATVTEFNQQILPTHDSNGNPTGFSSTKVWGFEGEAKDAITGESLGLVQSTPGPTFEAIQGVPIHVKWVNNLVDAAGKPLTHLFPVDPTLHWANPNGMEMPMSPVTAPSFPPGYPNAQSPVPIVIHLHGGEVASTSDGHPEAWWTANGIHGPAYTTASTTDANSAVFIYPNGQQPTTLWYHDHALGITRLNVVAGLAGFYILRSTTDPLAELLPSGEYEMPLVIQDRNFLTDGSLYFRSDGVNPTIHPYWQPSFLGNTIMVNGKVWPNMNVKQGQYRFRILDGSNSRFYNLSLSNGMSFIQIGSDGGYLKAPVQLSSLLIAPAQRADILIDFSDVPAGQTVRLQNFFTIGDSPVVRQTVGQIIQFTVTNDTGFTRKQLPSNLNPTLAGDYPTLTSPKKQRILTLTEVPGPNGFLALLLDGQRWDAPTSEVPELGTTEEWVIVNPTQDAHPIHLHLVQFQLVQRQTFNSTAYMADWAALNGEPPLNHPTVNVASLEPYLIGLPVEAAPNEQGWIDTVEANYGEITVIRLRFASQDGTPFPFDATVGPGYVWHCHIIDHEDNEMMRLYTVTKTPESLIPEALLIITLILIIVIILGVIRFRHRVRRK